MRVPFIASWPSGLPMGSVVHTPAMTIDVLPTIAALIERPVSRVDGVDLTRLLRDGADGSLEERPLAFYYNANDFEALRKGKWKLVFPHEYRTLAGEPGRDGTPGPYKQRRAGLELYDLNADPKEMSNVADLHAAVVADLQLDAERFRSDLGDALTKRPGPGRRKVGSTESR